jgi:hypothetical protein
VRVKAYGYRDTWHDESGWGDWSVNFLPGIEVRHGWSPDDKSLCILLGWLLWGFTIDIRWGKGQWR